MKILLIGGTGTISSAITRQLAAGGHDLWLLNRGNRRSEVPANVKQIIADIDDEKSVLSGLPAETFDAVCEFIGFVPQQVERDVPGFQATTRFDEGVRRCVGHILAHPELQVADPEFDAWCDRVIEAQEQAKKKLKEQ